MALFWIEKRGLHAIKASVVTAENRAAAAQFTMLDEEFYNSVKIVELEDDWEKPRVLMSSSYIE